MVHELLFRWAMWPIGLLLCVVVFLLERRYKLWWPRNAEPLFLVLIWQEFQYIMDKAYWPQPPMLNPFSNYFVCMSDFLSVISENWLPHTIISPVYHEIKYSWKKLVFIIWKHLKVVHIPLDFDFNLDLVFFLQIIISGVKICQPGVMILLQSK